jgi:hypothetical protein
MSVRVNLTQNSVYIQSVRVLVLGRAMFVPCETEVHVYALALYRPSSWGLKVQLLLWMAASICS